MSALSAVEIAQLARNAGWTTSQDVSLATAISFAESGGRVDAVGGPNKNGTYDYGLWQINSVHKAYDKDKLLADPQYNANAAHEIFVGQGWKAWSSFNNNSYAKFLGQAQSASSQITGATAVTVPVSSDGQATPDGANPADQYSGITKVLWYVSNGNDFWKRVGIGLGGVSLLIISVWFLTGNVPGSGIAKTIVPAGKIAKMKGATHKAKVASAQRDSNRMTVNRKPKPTFTDKSSSVSKKAVSDRLAIAEAAG